MFVEWLNAVIFLLFQHQVIVEYDFKAKARIIDEIIKYLKRERFERFSIKKSIKVLSRLKIKNVCTQFESKMNEIAKT